MNLSSWLNYVLSLDSLSHLWAVHYEFSLSFSLWLENSKLVWLLVQLSEPHLGPELQALAPL